MKGQKRKKREEKYDKEEEEGEQVENSGPEVEEEAKAEEGEEKASPRKKVRKEDDEKAEELANELPSLPIIASHDQNNPNKQGIIFILERATLEVAKVGKVCFFGVFVYPLEICFWVFEFGGNFYLILFILSKFAFLGFRVTNF